MISTNLTPAKFLEKLEQLSNTAVAVDNTISICNNPNENANTLSSSGQLAAFAAILISKNSPAVNLAVTPAAAMTTIGKILNDAKNGQRISSGDILTVTGNIISLMGTIGLIVGAAPICI